MRHIKVGDTVAFRREVARKCDSQGVADFRATVTEVAGDWLFLRDASGGVRVMPSQTLCTVGRNGAVLQLVRG